MGDHAKPIAAVDEDFDHRFVIATNTFSTGGVV